MPTDDYKKRVTQEFIKSVETVISKGLAKTNAEIVEKLDWDAGAFSNVINGRRNAPPEKLEKLKEVFNLSTSYLEQRRNDKLSDDKGTPIYEEAPFTLTNTPSYRDTHIGEPDFWISIPGLRKCNYGCRAVGDSMHPLIRSHALVVGEEIIDWQSFLPKGDVYIIRAKNGQETVKYIQPHPTDDSKFLLVPYNKKATTDDIRKEDIAQLFKAKAVFNVL